MNFEAPEVRLKTDPETGQYIFQYGGPFKADDILLEHFIGRVDPHGEQFNHGHTTRAAEEIVREDGITDWSPKPNSEYHRKIHPEGNVAAIQKEQIALILERIDEINKSLLVITTDDSLLGHNHPPADIGLPPYRDEDREKIYSLLSKAEREISSPSLQPDAFLETGKAIVEKSRPYVSFAKSVAANIAADMVIGGVVWLLADANRIQLMNSLHQLGIWIIDLASSCGVTI